ncbi:MAG: arsenic resistance N-acetyltransferase ArsN2 [Vicinamibacteria bacterium]
MPESLSPPSIRAAARSELPEVLALLKECDLPREGVAEHLDGFLVARNDRKLLGVVGLERYGEIGLLRSLAVTPKARGHGIASHLVQALIDRARERGISVLYILTETAEDFFPRFGFERISRARLDARLEASAELQGACPETAVAMGLDIRVP